MRSAQKSGLVSLATKDSTLVVTWRRVIKRVLAKRITTKRMMSERQFERMIREKSVNIDYF